MQIPGGSLDVAGARSLDSCFPPSLLWYTENNEIEEEVVADVAVDNLSRSQLVEMARLKYLLYSISVLHDYGSSSLYYWRGNSLEGTFAYANGSGDDYGITWKKDVLALSAPDHESDRNMYNEGDEEAAISDPSYFFTNAFPQDLLRLLQEADFFRQARSDTREVDDATNTTAALWGRDNQIFVPEKWGTAEAEGLWCIANYFLSPDEALNGNGDGQGWLDISGVPPSHGKLALELNNRLKASAETELTATDARLLLTPCRDFLPTEKGIHECKRMLGRVGVKWK